MSIAKPIYKMTIDLTTFRTDALKDTLDRIRELTSDQEQTVAGEVRVKATIEGDNLAGLQAIRNQLEIYLRQQQTGLVSGTVDIKEPLIRPAPEPTPMDAAGWDGDDEAAVSSDFRDTVGRFVDKYNVESVELRHGDKVVELTAETARNAERMLRER